MGCAVSTNGFEIAEEKELPQFISKDDIQLVQESWLLVQEDMNNMGLVIFKRFFQENRDLKKLFYAKMHCPGMTLENVENLDFDDRKLMSHGRIVMEALGAAVECLTDSDQLSVLLIGIGERHVMYGVHADMVPRLWPAILASFEEEMGCHFNPRVGLAWKRVFRYIGSKVMEGIARWRCTNGNSKFLA